MSTLRHILVILALAAPAAAQPGTVTFAGYLLQSPTIVWVDLGDGLPMAPDSVLFAGDFLRCWRVKGEAAGAHEHPQAVHYNATFPNRDPIAPARPFLISGPRGTPFTITWHWCGFEGAPMGASPVRELNAWHVIDNRDWDGNGVADGRDIQRFLNDHAEGRTGLYDGIPVCDQRDIEAFNRAWGL